MTEETPAPRLRRILVALDAGEPSLTDLEEAARLAAGLEAELVGLFVEDTELLQAAALPVARVISSQSRAAGALDAATMQRALRVRANKSRAVLAAAAERWRVRWSFRVTRGTVEDQVVSEAAGYDFLALGTGGRTVRRSRTVATTRLVARRVPCSVLLLQRARIPGRPVVVVYEGSPAPLASGADLARVYDRGLTVYALGADAAAAESRAEEAVRWLGQQGRPGKVMPVAGATAAGLGELLRDQPSGLVVLDPKSPLAADLEAVLDDIGCSVCEVR